MKQSPSGDGNYNDAALFLYKLTGNYPGFQRLFSRYEKNDKRGSLEAARKTSGTGC